MKEFIVFCRYPYLGKTKTRLISKIGELKATLLYKKMAEYSIDLLRKLRADYGEKCVKISIHYTGASLSKFRTWIGNDINFVEQSNGNLGIRLTNAFEYSFNQGNDSVFIIGSDIPSLSFEILAEAVKTIHSYDVVIGPAIDGGYYLLGMKKFYPEIFENIEWGTETVYNDTCLIFNKLNLRKHTLKVLSDIDRVEDLIPDNFQEKEILNSILNFSS